MNVFCLIILFILGSSSASFLSVVAVRSHRSESLIYPRSHCDNCKNNLGFIELIPIFSYIFLKGKCKHCHELIDRTSFISEIFLGCLFVIAAFQSSPLDEIVIAINMLYLSLDDLEDMQVSRCFLMFFSVICIIFGHPRFLYLVITIVLTLVLLLINHQEKSIGNADIEFCGALVILIGVNSTIIVVFIACIMALFYLLIHNNYQMKLAFIPFLAFAYWISHLFHCFIK